MRWGPRPLAREIPDEPQEDLHLAQPRCEGQAPEHRQRRYEVPQEGRQEGQGWRQGPSAGGPATPDDMSAEVVEFITAIDEYKRKNQRPFPNWSEVLEIVKALGYTR